MNKRTYHVRFIVFVKEDRGEPPLSEEILADSNNEARQVFKDYMRAKYGYFEHRDYRILSVRLESNLEALEFGSKRGILLKADAEKAFKHLKKGGGVFIDVWKELQNIHVFPDDESDNIVRITIREPWDDAAQIANVIITSGGKIDPDKQLTELNVLLSDFGVLDEFILSYPSAMPDNPEQLNEMIEYGREMFADENEGTLRSVVEHYGGSI